MKPPLLPLCPFACVIAAAGCGDLVRYDPDSAPSPSPPAVAGPRQFYLTCEDRHARGDAVDPADYDTLLSRYVTMDEDGFALVDYIAWVQALDDLGVLDGYVQSLADATPEPCDLAFWINAYNANVLRAVLQQFGGSEDFSVSDDGFAFFTGLRYPVAGAMMTLDELEHGVVRGRFDHPSVEGSASLEELRSLHDVLWQGETPDARIHMALNCAARGCPNLRPVAYANAALDSQLGEAAATFLDNPQKGAGPQGISQLFEWFGPDFDRDSGGVEAFIARERSAALEGVDSSRFITYDWSLNIVPVD